MGVNSLPKTVTRQHRGCDLKPGPSALESSMLTSRLPSHPLLLERYSFPVPLRVGGCVGLSGWMYIKMSHA